MPGALSLCCGAAEFWGWGLGGPPPGQERSWCRRLSFPSSPHRRLPGNTTCQRDAGGPVKLSPHGCEQRGRVPPPCCPPSAGARRLERSWVGAAPGQSHRLVATEPMGDLWPWEAAHHAGGSVDGSPSPAAGSLGGPSRTSAMGGGTQGWEQSRAGQEGAELGVGQAWWHCHCSSHRSPNIPPSACAQHPPPSIPILFASVLAGDRSQMSPWGCQRCPLPHPVGRSTLRMSPPAPVPVPTPCRSTQHPPSLPKAPLNAVTFPPDAHSRRLWGCLLTVLPAGWLSHRSHHQGTNPEHPPGLGGSRGPPLSPPHPPQLGSP